VSERPQNKNLKNFKPGQSGNPSGRKKGLITKSEIEELVSRCFIMTKIELKELIDNPSSKMMELYVASIIANGMKKGELYSFDGLLNRVIGKVKDEIAVENAHFSLNYKLEKKSDDQE